MNKIIAVINDDNIVSRVLDYSLLETVKDKNYKIYSSSCDISSGMHIDNYTDKGKILSLSERVEKGLFIVPEGKILDGEEIRDKTEVEFYLDNPMSEENILKILDIDEGIEYLRNKTMLEKYNDKLVSKDEYNAYQRQRREQEYENTTDKQYTALSARLARSDIEQAEYDEQLLLLNEAVVEIQEKYSYID